MPLVNKTFSEIITFTRATSGTYFDATGTLQSAGNNVARFDYNPATLAPRGFLIEEQRTNLLTYSAQFDNAAWTKTNASITADAASSPAGTVTGDKLVEDTANSTHQAYQSFTTVNGTTYTLSVFVKAAERTEVAIRLGSSAGAFSAAAQVLVNLSTGAVVSGSGTVTAINNGWYQISVSNTAIAAALADSILRISVAGNTTYTGDGTSGLYIWGVQLEAGAFPTSYIPTTTATITRNADVASVNTLSPWYNASAGTLYFEGSVFSASSYRSLIYIDDGTVSNRIYLDENSGPARAVSTAGGVNQCLITLASVSANTTFKLAGAFATNDCAASLNAGAVGTDTTATMPTVTTMRLGSDGVNFLCGYIRRISYYPRRLSNAELQTLTT